jgi:DNA-binding response OmpR family regulator
MAKIKVFYVEDEASLGRIVKDTLESQGFEVLMLADGKNAIQQFENFAPDICVLDIMLPTKDGYAIAREVRMQNPRIPVIFLTAKTQTADLLKGFESGGNDYIKKPFSLEELIARINNLLKLTKQHSAAGTSVFNIGKYEFFPNKYELRFADTTRKLSHREAELLKIFAENQNMIIQRKAILMQVWNDDSFFNSRSLDVYITRLRDFLKADENIQIVSIKGVGYHFVVE